MKLPSKSLLGLGFVSLLGVAFAAGPQAYRATSDFWGSKYKLTQQAPLPTTAAQGGAVGASQRIRHWNEMAYNASGLSHTPGAFFGEQVGPVRAARALAIVQIAVFEAVNCIEGKYQSFAQMSRVDVNTSMNCAIAQAAHDTLCALWPAQKASFDTLLNDELSKAPKGKPTAKGIKLGADCAAKILALKANDGSNYVEPKVNIDFIPSNAPGMWRQDPISQHPLALGAYWGQVKPFVVQTASQFRCPVPPALNSAEYTAGYNEVKSLGGDGIITPTSRTPEQTEIGIFWAYDGVPSLCAPPRLYNQIVMHIADQRGTSSNPVELARLLALVNVAMADAGVTSWESKFFYQYWRPITGIRESDVGTGPTGYGDGNAETTGDVNFSPLGAPASNLTGPNFTPPFPAYPSGHATFGGAIFQILRNYYGRDDIAFTFVSDELNGVTKDNQGNVRPLVSRSFNSFSQAEEENGQSRIYLGIHWAWDKNEGINMGRKVADYVYANAFTKRKPGK